MVEQLTGYIIHLISQSGYLAVFILMTLESALLPIPSEVTMPFAGFLAQGGQLNFWLVVLLGALGNLTGSLIAYAVGFYLEESVILELIKKYGKFILVTEHEYLRAVKWFGKFGSPIAFFSRLLPVVRTFISLPAGLSEMNIWKFSFYTFVGSFLWSAFLTWIGFFLGTKWNSWEPYFKKFQYVIVALIIVAILWYLNHKLKIIKLGKKD
ncbi:MAG TPA: DedA family protein [Patescibacteria group bacterium]